MSNSLPPHGLYSPWDSPGQNTGVGSLSILQGIFPPHGSNPCLWHCRRILYQLSQQGSPRILEWVAYPFSRGSSRPRNRIGVSCIAGKFFTCWTTGKPNAGISFHYFKLLVNFSIFCSFLCNNIAYFKYMFLCIWCFIILFYISLSCCLLLI